MICIRMFCCVAMAVGFLSNSFAANPTSTSKIMKHARAVSAASSALEKSIRDNRTHEVAIHAEKARTAAADIISDVLKSGEQDQILSTASAVEKTAGALVVIGKEGTISENGMLVDRLNSEANALEQIAKGGKQPSKNKAVGNKLCPISNKRVGSMQKGSQLNYKGWVVGLCCDPCSKKFHTDPEAYLKKAQADAAKNK